MATLAYLAVSTQFRVDNLSWAVDGSATLRQHQDQPCFQPASAVAKSSQHCGKDTRALQEVQEDGTPAGSLVLVLGQVLVQQEPVQMHTTYF